MKKIVISTFLGSALSACATISDSTSYTANDSTDLLVYDQVNNFKYTATINVDRRGKSADSSHQRELQRQAINLKFSREHACYHGVQIGKPKAIQLETDQYKLQYSITCNSV